MKFITKSMDIEEIVEKFPETIGPMQDMGVQCLVCGEPVWGTLEEKVKEKGLPMDTVVERLNRVVSEKNKQNK